MSREWQSLGGEVRRTGRSAGAGGGPRMGPPDGFVGRLVVELWVAGASTGDGLRYSLESVAEDTPVGRNRFVREAISRLQARLQGQP